MKKKKKNHTFKNQTLEIITSFTYTFKINSLQNKIHLSKHWKKFL